MTTITGDGRLSEFIPAGDGALYVCETGEGGLRVCESPESIDDRLSEIVVALTGYVICDHTLMAVSRAESPEEALDLAVAIALKRLPELKRLRSERARRERVYNQNRAALAATVRERGRLICANIIASEE